MNAKPKKNRQSKFHAQNKSSETKEEKLKKWRPSWTFQEVNMGGKIFYLNNLSSMIDVFIKGLSTLFYGKLQGP